MSAAWMITNSEKKSRASILTHCIHISPSALLGLLSFLRCSFLFVWPSMDVDVGSTSPPLLFLPLLVVTLQTCIHTYTLPYVSTYDCDAYIDDRHVDEHACAPYKPGTQTYLCTPHCTVTLTTNYEDALYVNKRSRRS